MPLLAFAKEQLDPDLALAQGLLIGRGLLVGPHALLHRRMEGAMDDAALRPRRTGLFHRTGIADGGIRPVLDLLRLIFGTAPLEDLPLRTTIDILLGIVGKLVRAIQLWTPIPLINPPHLAPAPHPFPPPPPL